MGRSRWNVLTREFIEDRVAKLPDAPGCWLWTGHLMSRGYGSVSFNNRETLAHRASFLVFHGVEPGEFYVCHRCDTPSCVNPEHLFLGTQRDNIHDMIRKGRDRSCGGKNGLVWKAARGEHHGRAKLTEQRVREIRRSSEPAAVCALRFGVDKSTVKDIRRRRTWAWLPDAADESNEGKVA